MRTAFPHIARREQPRRPVTRSRRPLERGGESGRGLTVEESIELLKLIVAAGVDIVQVSAGNDATAEWICQPMFMDKACLADSAATIKQALDIPIMAVGRINDPVVAEEIIRQGKADLVCVGRGLLADPEMPKKAQEGRLDDIRMCIACNTCMESIFRKGRVECLVNPTLGREKEMELRPAEKKKRVMVVGGGPGGLHMAAVAAARGHEVLLFEKQLQLGGQLLLGSATQYKKELLGLIRFYVVAAPSGSGQAPPQPGSLAARLAPRPGRALPGLARHRLVFAADDSDLAREPGQPPWPVGVYEVVPGARVVGRVAPGSRSVHFELGLALGPHAPLRYRADAEVTPSGAYEARLPYPGTGWVVRSGARRAGLALSEADVREGLTVPGPSFER